MKICKILTAFTAVCAVFTTAVGAETVNHTVSAGKTSQIFFFYIYDRDQCRGMGYPKTTFRKPANGQLSYRQTPFRIKKGERCAGSKVNAVTVFYTPRSGFRGKERARFGFSYPLFVDGEGSKYFGVTANISVK